MLFLSGNCRPRHCARRSPSPVSQTPPVAAEKPNPAFLKQLQTLQQLGFSDRPAAIAALLQARGDLNLAVQHLLNEN